MSELSRIGMKLSVPYNHDWVIFKELYPYREDIDNIYFPPPPSLTGSGRSWHGPKNISYRKTIPHIVDAILKIGVEPELLLNAIWINENKYASIFRFLRVMIEAGVSRITVADLHFAMALRKEYPDILMTVSCVAFVHNALRARYWHDLVGADRIVVDPSANKNLEEIRKIGALGLSVELMPANSCMPWCPFQAQHYYGLSIKRSGQNESKATLDNFCKTYRNDPENVWRLFSCEVVPADVKRYEGIVNVIKVTSRDSPTREIITRVKNYTRLKSRKHPDYGYIEPENIFDRIKSCSRDCDHCEHCRKSFFSVNPYYRNKVVDLPEEYF